MADGSITKSLVMTSPVIAAAIISLLFSVNLAMNPEPEATFTPPTTTAQPTQTAPPTTTPNNIGAGGLDVALAMAGYPYYLSCPPPTTTPPTAPPTTTIPPVQDF